MFVFEGRVSLFLYPGFAYAKVVVAKPTAQTFQRREKHHMQVNVSARHGSLQSGDQSLVVEKVEKLRRLYDRMTAIDVTVDLKTIDRPSVEIKVSVEHSDDLVATAESTTVVSAIDLAIPKAEQQLRKLKEKKTGHRATAHKHIDPVITDSGSPKEK